MPILHYRCLLHNILYPAYLIYILDTGTMLFRPPEPAAFFTDVYQAQHQRVHQEKTSSCASWSTSFSLSICAHQHFCICIMKLRMQIKETEVCRGRQDGGGVELQGKGSKSMHFEYFLPSHVCRCMFAVRAFPKAAAVSPYAVPC